MSTDDRVLTEEESEALLEESAAETDDESASGKGGIRDIDMTFWEQVAPDKIPAFESINDDTAELIDAIWLQRHKSEIVTSAEPFRYKTWREYCTNFEQLLAVTPIDVTSRGERGLIVFKPETVYAMVDLYFGGTGSAARSPNLTELTEMESRLARQFARHLVERMTAAWSRFVNVELEASELTYDHETMPVAEARARIVVVPFTFDLGESQHVIQMVWPGTLIDFLRGSKRPSARVPTTSPAFDWNTRLQEDLQAARVSLRAVLGGVEVKLGDVTQARPGDIIPTDALSIVTLYAGNQPVLEGELGAHRGFNAVKIRRPVNRRLFGES